MKNLLKNTLRQSGVEATEEMLTEVSNILSDVAIRGHDSNFHQSVKNYMAQGMTIQEANRQTFYDSIRQVGLSGVSGFLSGNVKSGSQNTVELAGNAKTVQNIYGTEAQALVDEALDLNPHNALAIWMDSRLANGKGVSGLQLSTLVEQNEAKIKSLGSAAYQGTEVGDLFWMGTPEGDNYAPAYDEYYGEAERIKKEDPFFRVIPRLY